MRLAPVCLTLLLAGCAVPETTHDAGPDEVAGGPDPPRIDVSTDLAGDAWTFRATVNNTTGRSIWLAQRSCDAGVGVVLHNATHGQAGSTPPGLACGAAPPRELPADGVHRFEWTWDGTVWGEGAFVAAPAGAYAATVWTAWAWDRSFETVHDQETRITAWWPAT